MQAQRVKSKEELEQEKRDEEFARQLAMEDENQARAMQQIQQQQQAPVQLPPAQQPGGQAVRQVTCQTCMATNNIPAGHQGSFACGACGRPISLAPTTSSGAAVTTHITPQPAPAPARTAQVTQNPTNTITCQYCRALNQIPQGSGATQFMCGGCHRILSFNQAPPSAPVHQAHQAPPSVPIGGPSSGTTPIGSEAMPSQPQPQVAHQQQPLQGQPLQGQPAGPRMVQVRCFQCQTINSVQQVPGRELQFICGSCKAMNKV